MPEIALTNKAQNDLENLAEYYAATVNDEFAEEVVTYMLQQIDQLQLFPSLGRPSQVEDVRELIFGRYPFYAAYTLQAGQVVVLRVNHQRKQQSTDW